MSHDFYNAIFKRKSIRKYKQTPLDKENLNQVQCFIEEINPLYPAIKTEIIILSDENVKSILPIKAPHYIAIYSEAKEGYLENVGFMLQQMDLFLSSIGIGSCWLGMGKPDKASASRNGLEYIITLAFGNANEPVYRESVAAFKRKSMSEISEADGADALLEAVRLAPSASNSQPWHFSGDKGQIIISRKVPNIVTAALYSKFNQVDIGIAMFHLQLAALHFGKTIEFKKEPLPVPKGYVYIATAWIQASSKT